MPDSTPPAADHTEPASQPEPEPAKTFTQAELEKIVGERLARERAKYGDYDDLKAKAAKFDSLEQKNKSDLEREREAREAAEKKAADAMAAANARLIRAEVIAAAAAAGAVDTDAVVALLAEGAVTVADDGTVTGAEEAVKALLEAKPWLKATATSGNNGGFDGGARPGQAKDGFEVGRQMALARFGKDKKE
jgi:hypothetical protein